MRMNRKAALAAGATLGIAFLTACSDSPTAPTASPVPLKPAFLVGDVVGTLVNNVPQPGRLTICKEGNVNGTFTVTHVNVSGGTGTSAGAGFVVATGECRIAAVGNSASGSAIEVTVNETSAGLVSTSEQDVVDADGSGPGAPVVGSQFSPRAANPYTINIIHGTRLTFVNHVEPPGNEGCTPGYWKQEQHFGNWAPVSLGQTFAGAGFTFGFTGTLLEGLNANGGGINALARHAAAAYLNSFSSGVDYAYTTAQVLAIANGTGIYSGLSVEARKDLLAAANEGVGGCPLARAEL